MASALSIFVLVVGVACWMSMLRRGGSAATELRRKIRIATPFSVNAGLILIADQRGFFKEEGLQVELKEFSSGRLALESMFAGESQYAVAFETPISLSILQGYAPVIISEIFTTSRNKALLHSKSFKFKEPRDLIGARIGLPLGTTAEFALRLSLMAGGLDWNDVKVYDLAPELLERHLKEGTIDAIVIWEPNVSEIYEHNHAKLRRVEISLFSETSDLVSRREELRSHPDTAKALLRALAKAAAFYGSRRAEAQRLIERRTKISRSPSIEAMWERTRFQLGLTSVLVTMLQEETSWHARYRNPGSVAASQIEDFIDPSFLEGISPELVTYR